MELKIWQLVVLLVGTFDLAFMLGACWATKDLQESFVEEEPKDPTSKFLMDGKL